MLKVRTNLSQTGDTIVEVMAVLAILGLALAISYATSNRSLLNTRQAEENAQATRYAQSQIESLYNLAATANAIRPGGASYPGDNNTGDIFSWDKAFCMSNPSTITTGTTCTNIDGLYTVDVYYCDHLLPSIPSPCPSPLSGVDTFAVQISWTDVSGEGQDTVTQTYRIHPGEGAS
jgi:type II secretory pathway pseudopilin PulG